MTIEGMGVSGSANHCFIVVYQQQIVSTHKGQWFVPRASVNQWGDDVVARSIYVDSLFADAFFVLEVDEIAPAFERLDSRLLMETLTPAASQLISRALQLLTWRKQHQFCGQCGRPTTLHAEETALVCKPCDITFYPRISPCIMCLVVRDDYCLLAHHSRHQPGLYSTLAGFVEAGESLEQAIYREVEEEVSLAIKNIRYFASQPWPFPHQLMVAYFAEYDRGEIREDGKEILDAQWFHYTDLPVIPPTSTLSGQLIEAFVNTRDTPSFP